MNKTIAIVNIGGNETSNGLRQILESFGFMVVMYLVGRPQHFIELLKGKMITKCDFIVIDCHGDDDGIVMPKLGEDIYLSIEPRGNFGVEEISTYITWVNTCIINTGCITGVEKFAKAFVKNGNVYIAPNDYIEGNSCLAFLVLFFYYLTRGYNIEIAHKKASSIDDETFTYVLRK